MAALAMNIMSLEKAINPAISDDYFYSKLYESSLQLKQASKTDSIPVLNAKASSLSFYQNMDAFSDIFL